MAPQIMKPRTLLRVIRTDEDGIASTSKVAAETGQDTEQDGVRQRAGRFSAGGVERGVCVVLDDRADGQRVGRMILMNDDVRGGSRGDGGSVEESVVNAAVPRRARHQDALLGQV